MELGFGKQQGKYRGEERAEQRGGVLILSQGSRGGGGSGRGALEVDTATGCGGVEALGRYSEEDDRGFLETPLALFFFHHKQVLPHYKEVLFYFFSKPEHFFDLFGAVKHFRKI